MDFVRLPERQKQWCAPGSSACSLPWFSQAAGRLLTLDGLRMEVHALCDGKSDSSILLLKHCLGRTAQAGFLCLSFSVREVWLEEKGRW